uniref:Uncharacterized protein n=1 Tax=Pyxicephalus adspersus TaxID=30357 RepID=A0AAV3A1Z7_PYXAD|nr:TPA: hypothetical protein GDO54_003072 [Pyxicephalus adspersus]
MQTRSVGGGWMVRVPFSHQCLIHFGSCAAVKCAVLHPSCVNESLGTARGCRNLLLLEVSECIDYSSTNNLQYFYYYQAGFI